MTERFAGKRALVTGGSRGIGAAIARQLFVTQAAAAVMGAGGRIVLMSSVSARIGVRR